MKELFPDTPLRAAAGRAPDLDGRTSPCRRAFARAEGRRAGLQDGGHLQPAGRCRLLGGRTSRPNDGRGRATAFRLGGNIIAYATGMEPPQPRLTQVEVADGKDEPHACRAASSRWPSSGTRATGSRPRGRCAT